MWCYHLSIEGTKKPVKYGSNQKLHKAIVENLLKEGCNVTSCHWGSIIIQSNMSFDVLNTRLLDIIDGDAAFTLTGVTECVKGKFDCVTVGNEKHIKKFDRMKNIIQKT